MNVARVLLYAALVPVAAFGQASPARLEFEVAAVKPSPPGAPEQVRVGLRIDGAQVHIAYLTLRDYIGMAYRVRNYQVMGPDWLAMDRFDIDAKLPAGAESGKVPEMLQALLADRFGVQLHREAKPLQVYALMVGSGGPKLKESPVDADAGGGAAAGAVDVAAGGSANGVNISLGRGSYFSLEPGKLEARKMTMTAFADTLARFVDRPVVDMTELKGTYDVSVGLTPEDYRALLIQTAVNNGVTLPPEALRALQQGGTNEPVSNAMRALGLKLDPRKTPLEVLVIDRALKTPSAN
jgi:uncharacterized protein (TIGR03435 family)